MSGDILMIEGFDSVSFDPATNRCRTATGAFASCDGASAMSNIIPPDVAGFDAFAVTQFMPDANELRQTFVGGGAAAGAMVLGLGVERFLQTNVPMIPQGAYPVIHVGLGAAAGKFLSTINPAVGVGWALGMAGLGFIRFLQTWLNVDVSLSGVFAGADLGNLSDLMDADDLLPPELSGLDDLVIEDQALEGDYFGNVAVETDSLNGWSRM